MSEEFKIEIINPEKSFLNREDVNEVVIPALEGEMGILKDHISIISFLKPGIIKIFSRNGKEKFYVEDGIVEFKDNFLSILTSSIFNLEGIDSKYISQSIENAEKELSQENIEDYKKFIISQKIDALKSNLTTIIKKRS